MGSTCYRNRKNIALKEKKEIFLFSGVQFKQLFGYSVSNMCALPYHQIVGLNEQAFESIVDFMLLLECHRTYAINP